MIRVAAILVSSTLISSCAPVEGTDRSDPALIGPPVKVLSEAENCISRSRIRNSRVRSDQVIDFEMSGGRVYRSILPNRCPRLGFEEAFTYTTSIDQLCSTEIIYVLDQVGGEIRKGAGCGLGKFVPVEYVDENESD